MIRIATFLLVAVGFYFGFTFLIELKNPEVKNLTAKQSVIGPENSSQVPEVALGFFEIDTLGSQKWLRSQKQLSTKTREAMAAEQHKATELAFNGETIWFSQQTDVHPVDILEVTDKHVSCKIHKPNAPFTAFLQWDSTGALWFSHYNYQQDGKKQLYRARYQHAKKK